MLFFDSQFAYWIVGLVTYFCLAVFYHPYGAYEIYDEFFSISSLRIMLLTAYIFIIQIIVWLVVKLIKHFLLKKRKKHAIQWESCIVTFFIAVFFQVGLFILHFTILPLIFGSLIADDTYISRIVIISTTAIVSFVGIYFLDTPIIFWIFGNWLYFIFLSYFQHFDAYGIESTSIDVQLNQLFIISSIVIFTQIMVWILIEVIKYFKQRRPLYKGNK